MLRVKVRHFALATRRRDMRHIMQIHRVDAFSAYLVNE